MPVTKLKAAMIIFSILTYFPVEILMICPWGVEGHQDLQGYFTLSESLCCKLNVIKFMANSARVIAVFY